MLSIDELIPILSFVIIKSGLTHWTATLAFLQHFMLNDLTTDICDENGADSFLVTTLEAAITYVKELKKSTTTINIYNRQLQQPSQIPAPTSIASPLLKFSSKSDFMLYVFHQIRSGNDAELIRIFKTEQKRIEIINRPTNDDPMPASLSSTLCHPLCDCSKCNAVLSANRVTIDIQTMHGRSAMHVAAQNGLPKQINLLLALGASLQLRDENNWTALHYAAARGHQNALLLLLHAGIDINATTSEQLTALHLSCMNGHSGCVKALLYYCDHMRVKVNTNFTTKMGDTALHLAAKWGFAECIETLLEYGVQVDQQNRLGTTASDLAHSSAVRRQLQNVFIIIDEVVDTLDDISMTTLRPEPFRGCISDEVLAATANGTTKTIADKVVTALRNGDIQLAYHFLGVTPTPAPPQWSDDNVDIADQCHPLCTCQKCNRRLSTATSTMDTNSNCVRRSRQINDDVNAFAADGFTMLHAAAQMGNFVFTKFLLDQSIGLSLNHRTEYSNQTALHLAVLSGSVEEVDLIVAAMSEKELNACDMDGNTALSLAVASGDVRIVDALLQFEPRLDLKNETGKTALDVARESYHFKICQMLEIAEAGADDSEL